MPPPRPTAPRSQRPVWLPDRAVDERGFDHVRVHVQLLDDPRVGAFHLAVYMGIARHAEVASGNCYPSAPTLARYAGCSERKVREVLEDLVQWAYIRRERRPGHASTLVLLRPPALSPARHLLQGSGGSTPAPPAGDPGTTFRGTPAHGADEQEPDNEIQNSTPGDVVVISGSGAIPALTPNRLPRLDPRGGLDAARTALHPRRPR